MVSAKLGMLLLRQIRKRRDGNGTKRNAKKRKAKKRRFWVRPMLLNRKEQSQYHNLMAELERDDREYYFRYLRMSPDRFKHLLTLVEADITKSSLWRGSILPAERLGICLRYLATGDSQQSQSFNFRVGRSTVCNIVKEVCDALWARLSPTYLKMPATTQEWKKVAEEFEQMWDYPLVLGCFDGKHVAIECPSYGGSLFYNYKQFHSVVLMAMCDSGYRFTFVDIGAYGGDNDAAILNRTKFFQDLESGSIPIPPPKTLGAKQFPYTFLSDEIFPLRTWLMKPYPGKQLQHQQRVFNYRLSRARRTIENSFGILSARWRIFRRPIRADVTTVERIIKATACLHNYLLYTDNASYKPDGFADSYSQDGTIIHGLWRQEPMMMQPIRQQGSGNYTLDAKQTRNNWCELFQSDAYKLDYQDAIVRDCGRVLDPQL